MSNHTTPVQGPAVLNQPVTTPAAHGLLRYAVACALGPYLLATTALLLFRPGWGG